jgi:hypothetical protein
MAVDIAALWHALNEGPQQGGTLAMGFKPLGSLLFATRRRKATGLPRQGYR